MMCLEKIREGNNFKTEMSDGGNEERNKDIFYFNLVYPIIEE